MKDSRISLDDPKLTAYALGELPADECTAVEAALANDAEARAAVEEIRAFGARLEAALANEPETDAARSGAPVGAAEGRKDGGPEGRPGAAALPGTRTKILRFPQVAWIGGTLAAACVAVLVALHPPVGRTVPAHSTSSASRAGRGSEPRQGKDASPNLKEAQPVRGEVTPTTAQSGDVTDGAVRRPRPTLQAQATPGEFTPLTARGAAGVSAPPQSAATIVVAGVADPGRLGAPSPATTEWSQPTPMRNVQFATNGTTVSGGVGAPLLQQVKPSAAAAPVVTPPAYAYNGALYVEPPHRKAGLVSLSAEPTRAEATPWATFSYASGASRIAGAAESARMQRVAAVRARRSYGGAHGVADAGDRPTYYYPPDEKFVVPVEPRVPHPFVVPAPPPVLNGETWETVPKPQPPWGAANGPQSFGYLKSNPGPFSFQLPYDWDNSMRNRLVLPRGAEPLVPPGPFDLLPGRRLEIRRFPLIRVQSQGAGTESYAYLHDNRFVAPADAPFSTFSVDVDTASYANVRRFIDGGRLPPPDAVRIEELVNYFPYHYPAPSATTATDGDSAAPFAASLEVASAPWAPTHRLVRIGLKARELPVAARPAVNLVFLLDVSGSMAAPNKLPLVKDSMRLLLNALRADDRVAIVTYAGTSGLALPSTPASQSGEILEALEALSAGGSTNGGMGLQLAYDIAKANFVKGGTNRVILCTDGDFNVGVTNQGDLTRLVQEKAKSGVALTVLGFGMGNYKDSTLELLADKGNGNYGYIDTRAEATKLLRDQVDGTLNTVAKDVKVQVDFNPARVARYRLIGYEDRALNAQDFNDDTVDAGEIGAGHAVTALYEIVPAGVDEVKSAGVDRSRYAAESPATIARDGPHANELLTVKIRYKQPDGDVSRKLEFPLVDRGASFANASADFRFAAAVAEFGMILRRSPYRGDATMRDVVAWAAAGSGKSDDDSAGYRGQFLELALKAERLMPLKSGK